MWSKVPTARTPRFPEINQQQHITKCTCMWEECIDGLVQERRNSSVLAMELLLSRTTSNPLIWSKSRFAIAWSDTTQESSSVQINPLAPSDTIWQQRSGSTLAEVMACCLKAPSHYLNQCWLINTKVFMAFIRGHYYEKISRSGLGSTP